MAFDYFTGQCDCGHINSDIGMGWCAECGTTDDRIKVYFFNGKGAGGCEELGPESVKKSESTRHKLEKTEDRIRRLEQWVNDLQSKMYVNCVYCGHRYGPNDEVPVSMSQALKDHIERCPEHPASKLKERVMELECEVERYRNNWRGREK